MIKDFKIKIRNIILDRIRWSLFKEVSSDIHSDILTSLINFNHLHITIKKQLFFEIENEIHKNENLV